jgi:DNA-binding response OmpR family regulator
MSIPPSVMVVDDEEELANLFSNFLERSGFNSVSFTDPLLALEHFSQNPERYSLVLTDLKMPELDGIQLAKRIREHNSSVAILLITAFYTTENLDRNDFKESNIAEVISKPVKLKDLRKRVTELCLTVK